MAASGRMLESWKEIAEHCGRSVRTVQRWAQRGLPVYRDAGGTSDRVYAFAEEIDAWRLAQALQGVDEQPWGRFVTFDDPDGNRWTLQQMPVR